MEISKLGREKWPDSFERVLSVPVLADNTSFDVTLRPFGYTAVSMDIHQNGMEPIRAWAYAITELMAATGGRYIENIQLD